MNLLTNIPHYFSYLLLKQLPTELRPQRILDVGCGKGWLTRELATFYSGSHIEGIDKDNKMIQSSRYEANQSNFDISYRIENVERLSSETYSDTYDLITCHNVLAHVRDSRTVLRNLLEWLSPGGTLSVVTENPAGKFIEVRMRDEQVTFDWFEDAYKQEGIRKVFREADDKLEEVLVKSTDQRILYPKASLESWLSEHPNITFEVKGCSTFMDYIKDPDKTSVDQLKLEKELESHEDWNMYAYFYHFQITKKE